MEGENERLVELEVVTEDTIASLDQQAVNLEVLPVNILLGSYGALQCGWIGKAYQKVLDDTLCNQVIFNSSRLRGIYGLFYIS